MKKIVVIGCSLSHIDLNAEERGRSIRYEITPYLWAATISGTTTTNGDESPPIDSDYSFFSLDNLDGVASATFTAHGQQWGFLFDFLYVAFEDTLLEGSPLQVKPRLKGTVLEFTGLYTPISVNDSHIIAGLRQQDIKEALNNSSLNYQSTGNIKCDFLFPSIFNRLRRSKMTAHPCAAETLN